MYARFACIVVTFLGVSLALTASHATDCCQVTVTDHSHFCKSAGGPNTNVFQCCEELDATGRAEGESCVFVTHPFGGDEITNYGRVRLDRYCDFDPGICVPGSRPTPVPPTPTPDLPRGNSVRLECDTFTLEGPRCPQRFFPDDPSPHCRPYACYGVLGSDPDPLYGGSNFVESCRDEVCGVPAQDRITAWCDYHQTCFYSHPECYCNLSCNQFTAGSVFGSDRNGQGIGCVLPLPTVTPTVVPGSCIGDCDGNRAVTVSELVTGVRIALGQASVDACSAMDADGGGTVSVNELVAAVAGALGGCRG